MEDSIIEVHVNVSINARYPQQGNLSLSESFTLPRQMTLIEAAKLLGAIGEVCKQIPKK